MSSQITKNQHYVPQFYLKRWGDNNKKINALNKQTSKIENEAIKNIMSEDFFYEIKPLTQKDKNFVLYIISKSENVQHKKFLEDFAQSYFSIGEAKDSATIDLASGKSIDAKSCKQVGIEDLFSKIESRGANVIQKIINKDKNWLSKDNSKYDLLIFMGLQYTRTKYMRKKYKRTVRKMKKYGDYSDALLNIVSILMGLESITSFIKRGCKITLLEIQGTKKNFITSDNPVINISSNWKKEIKMYFPISPIMALLIEENDKDSFLTEKIKDENKIEKYNQKIYDSSSMIFAVSKDILNDYKRPILLQKIMDLFLLNR